MSLFNIQSKTTEMMSLFGELALANPTVLPLMNEMRCDMNAIQPLLSELFYARKAVNAHFVLLDRAAIVTRYIAKYNSKYGYNVALANGLDYIHDEIILYRSSA
jgi:hypothetical protein